MTRGEMAKNWRDALKESVGKTIEHMAFSEAECFDDIENAEQYSTVGSPWDPEERGAFHRVKIAVEAPFQAEIFLACAHELSQEVADTIFSASGNQVSEELAYDTVAELLNTITGVFLRTFIPAGQTFVISLPEPWTEEDDSLLRQATDRNEHVAFLINGRTMVFYFLVKEASEKAPRSA